MHATRRAHRAKRVSAQSHAGGRRVGGVRRRALDLRLRRDRRRHCVDEGPRAPGSLFATSEPKQQAALTAKQVTAEIKYRDRTGSDEVLVRLHPSPPTRMRTHSWSAGRRERDGETVHTSMSGSGCWAPPPGAKYAGRDLSCGIQHVGHVVTRLLAAKRSDPRRRGCRAPRPLPSQRSGRVQCEHSRPAPPAS